MGWRSPEAALALPFVGGHPFGHAVHYLAWENLKGVAISLTIGMAVYFLFIHLVLMDRKGAEAVYLERWPRWLSLEERVYRPVIRGLYRVLNVVMRAVCDALDFLVLDGPADLPRDSRPRRHRSPRSAMIHAMTHGGQRTEQEAADRLGTILTPSADGGQPVLCPADGLPGIVHRPGVHPAVRFLIGQKSCRSLAAALLFAQETVVFARPV